MFGAIAVILLLVTIAKCDKLEGRIFTDRNGRRYDLNKFGGRPSYEVDDGMYHFEFNLYSSPIINYKDECNEDTGVCITTKKTTKQSSFSGGAVGNFTVKSNVSGEQGFTVEFYPQKTEIGTADYPVGKTEIEFICKNDKVVAECSGQENVIDLFGNRECSSNDNTIRADRCSCTVTRNYHNSYFITYKSTLGCSVNEQGPSAWPSFGAVFLIILLIVIVIYFFGGWLFIKCKTGARGWHSFPNVDFWRASPKLFVLGWRFLWSKLTCKPMAGQVAYVPLRVENVDLDTMGGMELGLDDSEDEKQESISTGNDGGNAIADEIENTAPTTTGMPVFTPEPVTMTATQRAAADLLDLDDEFNPTTSAINNVPMQL